MSNLTKSRKPKTQSKENTLNHKKNSLKPQKNNSLWKVHATKFSPKPKTISHKKTEPIHNFTNSSKKIKT